MKAQRNFYIFLLVIASYGCVAGSVYGSDIFWKRLANDTFQIKFEIYTDCSEPLDSINPEITSLPCSTAIPVLFGKPISHSTFNVTPRCSNERSKCETNPTLSYGMNKNTFIYKIYLGENTSCCWYKIILKGLKRDDEINNGNANTEFETSVALDRCVNTNVESIDFKNSPMRVYYKNFDGYYNHGIVQANGDSISFALPSPIHATFNSPFSAIYPLPCYGGPIKPTTISPFNGFGLDSLTGDISSRPTQNGYYNFRVEARQWKKVNGVYALVGISNRELLYIIIDKPITNPPTLSGPYSYQAYPGQQVCITVYSNDLDTDDTTRVFWDRKIPTGTFADNNGSVKHASCTFCWTPTEDDASCLPYYFNIIARDDHCMVEEYGIKQYQILVMPMLKTTEQYTKINCHTYQFKSAPTNRNGCLANIPYLIRWYEPKLVGTGNTTTLISKRDSVRYDFKEGGKYSIKHSVTVNGNTETTFDTLLIEPFNTANITNNDSTVNANDMVQLYAETKFNVPLNQYQWWANGKLIDTSSTVFVSPSKSTTYTLINKALSFPCDVTQDNVTLLVEGTVGINQLQKRLTMGVTTNPFQSNISFLNTEKEFNELTLVAMNGKIILKKQITETIIKIDTSNLPTGIYIVELKNEKRKELFKLIITN